MDPLQELRRAAIAGLTHGPVVQLAPRRRARASSLPEIPLDAPRPSRETLTFAMWDDAERWWRRAAQRWAPSLRRIVSLGVVCVEARGPRVGVTLRNASYLAEGVPAPWVAVLVCAVTGRELPAVRRALRAGVTRFTPEASWPIP